MFNNKIIRRIDKTKLFYKIIGGIIIAIIYVGLFWMFPYSVLKDEGQILLIIGMVHLVIFGGVLFLIVMCQSIWKGFLGK